MLRAHKIRLNPTSEQEASLLRAAGCARFAYNWALARYKELKAAGQKVDWNELKKEFRERIDTEFPFIREVTKCAPEQAIRDVRQAINTYYQVKTANPKTKLRFPGFRKRSKTIGGFGVANDKFRVNGHWVLIPKLGWVNMAESLRFKGSRLQKVDRFFPSSQRCHVCGDINADSTLDQRQWTCPHCGTRHDRDVNASQNLEMEGLRLLAGGGSVGVTPVELAATVSGSGQAQVADREAGRKT